LLKRPLLFFGTLIRMRPPPAQAPVPLAEAAEGPKDFYSSPRMAKLGGFTLYENLQTGEVFVATEVTEPGRPPMCRQPDCQLVAAAVHARLVKGTTAGFRAGGLTFAGTAQKSASGATGA
jgi:hypothetical protein